MPDPITVTGIVLIVVGYLALNIFRLARVWKYSSIYGWIEFVDTAPKAAIIKYFISLVIFLGIVVLEEFFSTVVAPNANIRWITRGLGAILFFPLIPYLLRYPIENLDRKFPISFLRTVFNFLILWDVEILIIIFFGPHLTSFHL